MTKETIFEILGKLCRDGIGQECLWEFVLNSRMRHERSEWLAAHPEGGNKGNGYRPRAVHIGGARYAVRIPRDRRGLFRPFLLEFLRLQDEAQEGIVSRLYACGMTTRDIGVTLRDLYGRAYAPQQRVADAGGHRGGRGGLAGPAAPAPGAGPLHRLPPRPGGPGRGGGAGGLLRGAGRAPGRAPRGAGHREPPHRGRGVLGPDARGAAGPGAGRGGRGGGRWPQGAGGRSGRHPARVRPPALHRAPAPQLPRRGPQGRPRPHARGSRPAPAGRRPRLHPGPGLARLGGFLARWARDSPRFSRLQGDESYRDCFTYLRFAPAAQRTLYSTNRIERLNRLFRRALRPRGHMPSAEAAVRLLARVAMECTGFYQHPVKGLMADIGGLIAERCDTPLQKCAGGGIFALRRPRPYSRHLQGCH